MARQYQEDEDNLKRQARRRLIGAVALTTAIVVVLPMLLDREPNPVLTDIEIDIPDKDKVGPLETESPPQPLSMPALPVDAASAPMPASLVPAPGAAPGPALAPQAPAQPSAPQEKFVVQVGAFSNAGSAQQLQKKLGKQGIKAYTEKVDNKTRVRTGPYATREAAEKVLHKLEKQGLKPVISQIEE